MAGITPNQMVTNVQDELHDDSLGNERVLRWINETQEDMDSRCYWHHLEVVPPFQTATQGPYSTGTVTVTNGSPIVTGSGTAFDTWMVNQPFTAQDDSNYYWVQSVDNPLQLTLTSNYTGTSAVGVTFTVDSFSLTLPTDLAAQKIKSVLIQNPHRELKYVDVKERNELFPNLLSGRSQPRAWMDWGPTTIQLWPVPDGQYNVIIRYQGRPVEAVTDLAAFSWPAQMHRCIQMGAMAQGWSWKDDNLAGDVRARYEAMLQNHVYENNRRPQDSAVCRPFDEQTYTDKFALIFGRRISQ